MTLGIVLSGQDESVASGEDMTTTNTRTYSAPRERDESERSRDTEETGVQSQKLLFL